MTAFPAIQARARVYDLPMRTSSEVQLTNGARVSWLRGEVASNAPLTITFLALTVAVAGSISAHYRTVKQHTGFSIDIAQWQSHPNLYDVTPANQGYRYVNPPALVPNGFGLFDVTIELTTFF
jgi:hypothetical protein